MSAPSSAQSPKVLRVAAVWGTSVVASRDLKSGVSLFVGDSGSPLPVPDGLVISPHPLFAVSSGWEIDAKGATGGRLYLRGREEDPVALGRSGASMPVVAGDYGLLQYGTFSIFFQHVDASPAPPRKSRLELLAFVALFSSAVLHVGVLGLLRALMTPPPIPKPLELTNPDEYAARFGLRRAALEELMTPENDSSGSHGGEPVPGEKQRKASGGSKAAGQEGKAARAVASRSAGEVDRTSSHVGGLSDVLNSEAGEEVRRTLKTMHGVADALNAVNAQTLLMGTGAGASLKGTGAGGGGQHETGFGAGTLNTGMGFGTSVGGGGGAGAGGRGGKGGAGAGGTGAGGTGSGVGEAKIGVTAGSPSSHGGLTDEQVRRVVMAHTGALRACYETEAQRNPNLRGGLTAVWQIEPSGSVSSVSLGSTTLSNPRVEGCVMRQIRAWHFPESDRPTSVASYPFRFGLSN